jgi:hypothetical protein
MWGNVRIHLPLGRNENFIFAFLGKSLQKYENFRENFFTKIDAKGGNIIDLEYLGNGASDWILFT